MTNVVNSKYYYEIDILRGIACLLVVLGHLPIYGSLDSGPFCFEGAYIGVYLFFVISGFIISKTFTTSLIKIDEFNFLNWCDVWIKNRSQIYSFWYRRYLRLLPALSVLFCFSGILVLRYGIRHGDILNSIVGFVRYCAAFLFLDHFWDHEVDGSVESFMLNSIGIGVTWTLICEILFYLIFPCVMILQNSPKVLPLIFIVTLIGKGVAYAIVPHGILYPCPIAYFDTFSAGVLIGFYHKKILFSPVVTKVLAMASLCIIILYDVRVGGYSNYRYYIDILLAASFLVYVASTQKGILRVPVVGAILNIIGVNSYFIYLMHTMINFILHQPFKDFISILSRYIPKLEVLIAKNSLIIDYSRHLFVLVITVILAELFRRFVERPFIQKNKHKVF